MNTIPTAEEFNNDIRYVTYSLDEKLITFAKLHVEAALKAAKDSAFCEDTYMGDGEHESWNVNENSILNSYPLSKIK